jgi:hypothetical protein
MTTQTRSRRRGASGRRRPARRGVPSAGRFGRRAPQKSGVGGLLERLTTALPTSGQKAKGGGAGKRAAGMAMLAGVAGLALKNRNRLTSLLGRAKSGEQSARMEGPLDPLTGP